MKFIYIDESGNTGKRTDDPFQPYHLVSGLIVDESKIILLENEIRILELRYFGEISRRSDFEFHGYEIHKGKGYFKKLKVDERIELMKSLLEIVQTYQLNVIYVLFDKKSSGNAAKFFHPHQEAFKQLVQQIEEYLLNEKTYGLLVADENPDTEKHLITEFEYFKSLNVTPPLGYKKIEKIVDSIHFVKSKHNRLIQLADVLSYVLLRGIKVKEALKERYDEESLQSEIKMSFESWNRFNTTTKYIR